MSTIEPAAAAEAKEGDVIARVALVLGGGKGVYLETAQALALCQGLPTMNFCCNDMIAEYPNTIDNAVTLHPEKLATWLSRRLRNGYPGIGHIWAHRAYMDSVTHWTKDWGGSSGLFATKIARENGFVKIILCGVPMTVEDEHFTRHARWNAAHGFRRAWDGRWPLYHEYTRSMSGWTAEKLGKPTREWLEGDMKDYRPMRPEPVHLKA